MKQKLAMVLKNKKVLAALVALSAALLAVFNVEMSEELQSNLLTGIGYAASLLAGWLAPSPMEPAVEPPKE